MNLNKLKQIYTSSPLILKKLYGSIPFSIRNGKVYRTWMKILRSREKIDRDPFNTFEYAKKNFDFYKRLYSQVETINWEKVPFTDKQMVQNLLSEVEEKKGKKFYVTTGGVTGKPAKFYQSTNVWYKELAFVNQLFSLFGYSPKNLKLSLRGGDFSNLPKNKYWIENPSSNEIHFSPFHLSSSTIKLYIEEINRIRPRFIHSYPSGLLNMVQLMKNSGLELSYRLDAIFLISESFSREEYNLLIDFFQCKVTSFYGHSERVIFAPYNGNNNSYTPDSYYGFFELIDDKGEVIKENNKIGEMVGTSYDNYAMPLIRYKTGDYTYYTDYSSKAFGPIQGKWGQDTLIGKNGEKITLTALNLHSTELSDLLRVQFVQKQNGLVKMRVQFLDFKTEKQFQTIENLLNKRVNKLIDFKIFQNEDFALNARGKTPLIISDYEK